VAAVFFNTLYLFVSIFLMYFEFYLSYFLTSAVFFALNVIATALSIAYGLNFVTGYLVSSFAAFLTAYILAKMDLKELIFNTFAFQPVSSEVEKNPVFDALKFFEKEGGSNILSRRGAPGFNIDEFEKNI